MPPAVELDAADVAFANCLLLAECFQAPCLEQTDTVLDDRPPGDPVAPSVRTEQLLL